MTDYLLEYERVLGGERLPLWRQEGNCLLSLGAEPQEGLPPQQNTNFQEKTRLKDPCRPGYLNPDWSTIDCCYSSDLRGVKCLRETPDTTAVTRRKTSVEKLGGGESLPSIFTGKHRHVAVRSSVFSYSEALCNNFCCVIVAIFKLWRSVLTACRQVWQEKIWPALLAVMRQKTSGVK